MSCAAEPMEVEEIPQAPLNVGAPENGTLTQSPFAHVNTGVYSGHPGLQAFLTLGVPVNAPLSAIKRAYRKLARAYHPDTLVNGASLQEQEAAHEKFAQISAAYDLLTHAYSQYDGKGNGENYPVFFGAPGSLETHKPKERDPYDLLRKKNSHLPDKPPKHCIIPGDSSSLFQAWPEAENQVPLCLPYEAQPPAMEDSMAMDADEIPHMKRTMMDDDMDMPRAKRQRMVEPSFNVATNGSANDNNTSMFNGNNAFGKRTAQEGMDFDIPSSKKRRTA